MESQNQTKLPQNAKGSNVTLIIIIVVLVLVILLGVGGFFGWRYFAKKLASSANPITSSSPTATPTLSPSPTATPTPTVTLTSALKTGTMPVNGYVIPDSNTRVISETELLNLTPWQLKVARNEIYARYGRPFVHKDLQCYFATQNWYHGNPNYSDSMLSAVENKNVATIQAYEKKINSPLQSFDSGC